MVVVVEAGIVFGVSGGIWPAVVLLVLLASTDCWFRRCF